MPYSREVSYTTTGTKASLDADPSIAPFNLHITVKLTTGPTSYKLQYTLDDFTSPTKADSDAVWYDSIDIPAGTTGDGQTLITSPITRYRLIIATLTAGSLKLQAQQGLSIN